MPTNFAFPGGDRKISVERLEQRALSRARLANELNQFATFNGQIDIFKHRMFRLLDGNGLELDKCFGFHEYQYRLKVSGLIRMFKSIASVMN